VGSGRRRKFVHGAKTFYDVCGFDTTNDQKMVVLLLFFSTNNFVFSCLTLLQRSPIHTGGTHPWQLGGISTVFFGSTPQQWRFFWRLWVTATGLERSSISLKTSELLIGKDSWPTHKAECKLHSERTTSQVAITSAIRRDFNVVITSVGDASSTTCTHLNLSAWKTQWMLRNNDS